MSISSRTRSKLKQIEVPRSLLLNLPEGIHDEIFLRVPAESILSSRCVCKFFNNLLSKPNFIKNHVNRTNQSKNNNPKLLCFFNGNPPKIYSVPIDYASISSSSSSLSCKFDRAVLIDYPFESKKTYRHNFLGSCNGIICLKIRSREGSTADFFYINIILNPLTREYKSFKEPQSFVELKSRGYNVTYGFGYDKNIEDYKLVIIFDFKEGGLFRFYVYTVKSNSWNIVQRNFNYTFRVLCEEISQYHSAGKGFHGVFFKEALHWLGSIVTEKNSSDVIVTFNLSTETMVDMPLPENMMPPIDFQGEMYSNLGVWGDCICVACIWGSVKIDVWVMNEYGVKESWTKKYTTTTTEVHRPCIPYWQLLWCFDNGEILVENCRSHLLLYHPTNESFKSVVVRDITMRNNRESYVESIVSLNSGTYLKKRITDGTMKNSN